MWCHCVGSHSLLVPLPQKILWGSTDPESLLASQKHPSPENVETLGQVSETFLYGARNFFGEPKAPCCDRVYGLPRVTFLLKKSKPAAATAAKSLQLCPTLCDPIDSSPPGSPVPGIRQARTLEWVAISFSNAEKWKVKGKSLSRVWLVVTPWTTVHQVSPSMGFSRQEYWSGVPSSSPKIQP